MYFVVCSVAVDVKSCHTLQFILQVLGFIVAK